MCIYFSTDFCWLSPWNLLKKERRLCMAIINSFSLISIFQSRYSFPRFWGKKRICASKHLLDQMLMGSLQITSRISSHHPQPPFPTNNSQVFILCTSWRSVFQLSWKSKGVPKCNHGGFLGCPRIKISHLPLKEKIQTGTSWCSLYTLYEPLGKIST